MQPKNTITFKINPKKVKTSSSCGGSEPCVAGCSTHPRKTEPKNTTLEETRLFKEGGSCFECCDYEGICSDMKKFVPLRDSQVRAEERNETMRLVELALKGEKLSGSTLFKLNQLLSHTQEGK